MGLYRVRRLIYKPDQAWPIVLVRFGARWPSNNRPRTRPRVFEGDGVSLFPCAHRQRLSRRYRPKIEDEDEFEFEDEDEGKARSGEASPLNRARSRARTRSLIAAGEKDTEDEHEDEHD